MTVPIRYVNLRAETPERRKQLSYAFYNQVYRNAFQRAEHAEDPTIWLPLLEPAVAMPLPLVHLIVALGDTAPSEAIEPSVLGGVIFELYRKSGCWFATYLAIAPDRQSQGLGRELWDRVIQTIQLEAPRTGLGSGVPILFAEAENPRKIPDPHDRAHAYRRLLTLEALGFRCVPFDYIQPALAKNKLPAKDLLFLTYDGGRPHFTGARLPTARPAEFLEEFYAALDQRGSDALTSMLSQLSKINAIEGKHLSEIVPARYDEVLGSAAAISIRFMFVHAHDHEIRLKTIRDLLIQSHLDRFLSRPIMSFYRDIVRPYATEGSLPIVVLCEPFREFADAAHCKPRAVSISFKPTITTVWEDRKSVICF